MSTQYIIVSPAAYKYHTDPTYRAHVIKNAVEHKKKTFEACPEAYERHKQLCKERARQRYQNDPEYRAKKLEYVRNKRALAKQQE